MKTFLFATLLTLSVTLTQAHVYTRYRRPILRPVVYPIVQPPIPVNNNFFESGFFGGNSFAIIGTYIIHVYIYTFFIVKLLLITDQS